MKIRDLFITIFIPLALLGWIWASRVPSSSQPASSIEAPKENFIAPDFTLETINGGSIALSALRGKPIILNFWASWCPPCRAEMPAFQQAWQEYQSTDLIILTINATNQDARTEIVDFIDENQLDLPILLDSYGNVSASYQVHSLPTTFLIDREGIITKVLIGGPIPLSLLRVQAETLLQENSYVPDN